MKRREVIGAGIGVAGLGLAPARAQAPYPNRPIKVLVGAAAGGGIDITARTLARHMSEKLGQQIVVDNRPGAGGNIAADLCAKSAPDGYTTLLSNVGVLSVAPYLIKTLSFDPAKDFAPVSLAVTFSNILVVHPSVAATNVAEYLALAKSGGMSYGSAGVGSAGHLAGELLASRAGVKLQHVSYRGGAPALNDVLAGQVPSVFASTPTVLPAIAAGKLRALGVTGPTRSASLPEVPTVAEQGYPGYEAMNWYALVVPARTPQPIIATLNTAFVEALNLPDNRTALAVHGMEPIPSTPEEMARYVAGESATWSKVVKEANITSE